MKTTLTLILILFIQLIHAQNPLVKQWDYRFGGTGQEVINSLQQTTDGGFILGGFSASSATGDKAQNSWGSYDFWIVKVDSLGIKQWDRDFGGIDDDQLYSFQQTTDGGYILAGTSNSGISGDKTQPNWDDVNFSHDFWIVKIDSLGNKEWDKDFGGTDNDYLVSVQQTKDGGYILGGNSVSGAGGDKTDPNWNPTNFTNDFWVVKIDSVGNKQWDKNLGGTDEDELATVRQTADGGYLLAGLSVSGIGGDKTEETWGGYDYWVIKTDSLGVKQWDKDFGGSGSDILYSMEYTSDGGAILGGVSNSGIDGNKTHPNWDNSNLTSDYWLVKMDAEGNKQWDKVLGGTIGEPRFGDVTQTLDGGYLASGISYSTISGNKTENNLGIEQGWVVKTDAVGAVQWDKTMFTTTEDENAYAIQTKEGCYLMANNTPAGIGGYKTQDDWGFGDFWIVKFCDTTSTIPTAVQPSFQLTGNVLVYPNPFADEITIHFHQQHANQLTCRIYDVTGRTVFSMQDEVAHEENSNKIDLNMLSKGIYFLEITIDGKKEVTKIIKE